MAARERPTPSSISFIQTIRLPKDLTDSLTEALRLPSCESSPRQTYGKPNNRRPANYSERAERYSMILQLLKDDSVKPARRSKGTGLSTGQSFMKSSEEGVQQARVSMSKLGRKNLRAAEDYASKTLASKTSMGVGEETHTVVSNPGEARRSTAENVEPDSAASKRGASLGKGVMSSVGPPKETAVRLSLRSTQQEIPPQRKGQVDCSSENAKGGLALTKGDLSGLVKTSRTGGGLRARLQEQPLNIGISPTREVSLPQKRVSAASRKEAVTPVQKDKRVDVQSLRTVGKDREQSRGDEKGAANECLSDLRPEGGPDGSRHGKGRGDYETADQHWVGPESRNGSLERVTEGSSHTLSPSSQEAALLAELERLDRQLASVRVTDRSGRRLAFVRHDQARREGKAPEARRQNDEIRGEFEVGLSREAGGSCVRTADSDAIRAFADAVKATVTSGGITGTETTIRKGVGGVGNLATRAPDKAFERRAASAEKTIRVERAESVRTTSRSGRALAQSVCRIEQPTVRRPQISHKIPSSSKPRLWRASEGDALKSRHASCAKPQTPKPFSRRRSEGALLMGEKVGSAPQRKTSLSKGGGAVPPDRRSDSASGIASAGDESLQGTAKAGLSTGSREKWSGESPFGDCELSPGENSLSHVPPDAFPTTDGTDGTDQGEDLFGGTEEERNGPEPTSTGKNADGKRVELRNPPLQSCAPVAKGSWVQLPEKGSEGSVHLAKPRCTFVKLSELAAKRGRAVSYTEERHAAAEGGLGLVAYPQCAEVLSGDSRCFQGSGAALRDGGDLGGAVERRRVASCTELGFDVESGDKLRSEASVGNGTFAVQWPDEGVGLEKGLCSEEKLQGKAAGGSSQVAEKKKKATKDSMERASPTPQTSNRAENCSSEPAYVAVWPVGIPEEDWGVFESGRKTDELPGRKKPDPETRANTTSFELSQAERSEVKCARATETVGTSTAGIAGKVQRDVSECGSDDLWLRAECAKLPTVRIRPEEGGQRRREDERLSKEGRDSGSPQRARARGGVSGFWEPLRILTTPSGCVNMGTEEDCQQTGAAVGGGPEPSLGAVMVTGESAGVVGEGGGLLGMPVAGSERFTVAVTDGRMRRVSVDSFDDLGWGQWHSTGGVENVVEEHTEKQGALQDEFRFAAIEANSEQVTAEEGRVRGLTIGSVAALSGGSWHLTETVGMAVGLMEEKLRHGMEGGDFGLEAGGADPERFVGESKEGRVRGFSIDSIDALGGETWQPVEVEGAGKETATDGSLQIRSAQEGNGMERKAAEEEAEGKEKEAVRIVEDTKQKAAGAERKANEVERKEVEVERKIGEAERKVDGTDRKREEFAETERIAGEAERKPSAWKNGEEATAGIETPADDLTGSADGREVGPRLGGNDGATERAPVEATGPFFQSESTRTRASLSGEAELRNGAEASAGSVSQLVAHFDFLQTGSAVHVSGTDSFSCMKSQSCVDKSSSSEKGAMGSAEFAVDVDIDAVRNGAEPIWVQWERELLDESREGSPLGDAGTSWGV